MLPWESLSRIEPWSAETGWSAGMQECQKAIINYASGDQVLCSMNIYKGITSRLKNMCTPVSVQALLSEPGINKLIKILCVYLYILVFLKQG